MGRWGSSPILRERSLIRPGARVRSSFNGEAMAADERKSCSYVRLEAFEIPDGWYNNQTSLGVFDLLLFDRRELFNRRFQNSILPCQKLVWFWTPRLCFVIDGRQRRLLTVWRGEWSRRLESVASFGYSVAASACVGVAPRRVVPPLQRCLGALRTQWIIYCQHWEAMRNVGEYSIGRLAH